MPQAAMIGAAIAAVGALTGGIAAKRQADFQAKVARQQASIARQKATQEAISFRKRASAAAAAGRVTTGAGGGDFASARSLLNAEQFAEEAELQAQNIKFGGELQAGRLQNEARLAKSRGRSALVGGIIGAGASVLAASSKFGSSTPAPLQGPGLDGIPIG